MRQIESARWTARIGRSAVTACLGSVELRFPIAGDLGGVVFVDAGNVDSGSFSYNLGDLRVGVGPGIRYNTPVGPLRVDFGIALNPRASDKFGRLDFSIGQSF